MTTLLPNKVYQYLRQGLLVGDFAPGARLDYRRIGHALGVSTTPVREAVSKLASEGLVTLVPRAGAVVRVLDEEETSQLYAVREAIETYAAGKAAARISPNGLMQLEQFLVQMRTLIARSAGKDRPGLRSDSLLEFVQADLSFHMTIIEAAGNPRLTKLAGESHAHSRIFGLERFTHTPELLREADAVHTQIFSAMKTRDAAQARQFTAQHIQRSLELTLAYKSRVNQASWWLMNSTAAAAP
jgi:DNA-binding GntR family transcriptional regulator